MALTATVMVVVAVVIVMVAIVVDCRRRDDDDDGAADAAGAAAAGRTLTFYRGTRERRLQSLRGIYRASPEAVYAAFNGLPSGMAPPCRHGS